MDDSKRKKISRGVLRSHTKQLEASINALMAGDSLTDAQATELKSLKKKFEDKVAKINAVEEELLALIVDETELKKEMEDMLMASDRDLDIVAKVEDCLGKLSLSPSGTPAKSTDTPSPKTSAADSHRLPKFELPKFTGDIKQWQTFWDQFESAVHKKTHLSNVDKFTYLLSSLDSTAKECVAGLALTNDNYMRAIELLKERFGNKQLLINAYVEACLKLPYVQSMSQVKELRAIYDMLEATVRNLQSLDIEPTTYGCFLVPILAQKLPDELKMIMSRKFKDDIWDLTGMMEVFKEELQAKERCTVQGFGNKSKKGTVSEDLFSTANLFSGGQQVSSAPRKGCLYCNKPNHPPSQCRTVTDVKARTNILRKARRCFNCLQPNHIVAKCTSDYRCNKCGAQHHISLCTAERTIPPPPSNPAGPAGSTPDQVDVAAAHTTSTTCSTLLSKPKVILLQTGRATVANPVNFLLSARLRLLSDGAAMRSYITKEGRERLRLKTVRRDWAMVSVFGGKDGKIELLDVVKVSVKSVYAERYIEVEVLVVPVICTPLRNQSPKVAQERYPHLNELFLADHVTSKEMPVDMLIGADSYYSIMTGNFIKGNIPNSPVALESQIGWILMGPVDTESKPDPQQFSLITTHVICASTADVDTTLKRFWEIESVGDGSNDDVINQFMNDISFDSSRNKYVTRLPFKPYRDVIPDNYSLCAKRLASVRRMFEKNPKLFKDYCEIFEDYKKKNIIQRVEEGDTGTPGEVHYIPHHPVVRVDRETTKVRPVFDASAKDGGPSLNECLYTGPNLLSRIFDILLRFRTYKIVLLSDIQQAFLQVGIHEDHVDFLRFLMVDPDDVNETVVYKFMTAVFGVTSSTFLLEATLHYHCNRIVEQGLVNSEFVQDFLRNLYVDDCMGATGARTVYDGFEWYKIAKHIMKLGGFNLRKWCTNDTELQTLIDEAESATLVAKVPAVEDTASFTQQEFKNSTAELPNLKSVLGVSWEKGEDEIIFDFTAIIELALNIKLTKRCLLRVSAKFYDPNGLVAPISIQAKMILQLVHKEHLDWDDIVSNDLQGVWRAFVNCLKECPTVKVPRFIDVFDADVSIQVHGFCDSSKLAYCAAIYVRMESSTGVKANLLTAKTKVAPLKEVSIPRLELLSCLLLVELMQAVHRALPELQDAETFYWSDSEIALGWIRGVQKQWNPWVEARVVKIRTKTITNGEVKLKCWRHIPGEVNPADIPTRPISPKELTPDSPWFVAPQFLYSSKDLWPDKAIEEHSITLELRKVNVLTTVLVQEKSSAMDIQVQKFSTIQRVLNVGAYVGRFVNNFVARFRKQDLRCGEFTVMEIEKAEALLIKDDQLFIRKSTKFKQLEKSLNLFTDEDGILRAAGRLENSDIDSTRKFPILLRDSHLAHLYIRDSHKEVFHEGPDATLNHFRNRFWVVRGRQVVRRSIYRCVTCRKNQGKTMAPPPTPPLPTYRLVSEHCFQSTGCDFAGPVLVKSIYSPDGKELFKAYICLFTCATSRAIHLELVPNLQGPTFIRAMRRFIGRRGFPKLLVSDNAKTFTCKVVKRFLVNNRIDKDFILPASPWWGGFYERLVRSVKVPLRKTLGKARLTYEEMETILIEIESVVNARPLTYLSEDNMMEPLSPSHLLSGRNIMKHPTSVSKPRTCHLDLVNRTRYLQQLMILFWNKFRTSYLAELREHHMHQSNRQKTNPATLKVDDVVVIKDDEFAPRSAWRIGRVESLIAGRDGMVRGGVIETVSKDGKRGKMSRPVQKLIPLEVQHGDSSDTSVNHEDSNDAPSVNGSIHLSSENSTFAPRDDCADAPLVNGSIRLSSENSAVVPSDDWADVSTVNGSICSISENSIPVASNERDDSLIPPGNLRRLPRVAAVAGERKRRLINDLK